MSRNKIPYSLDCLLSCLVRLKLISSETNQYISMSISRQAVTRMERFLLNGTKPL
jgi:hypothetical protein